jgi:hypothetical protein
MISGASFVSSTWPGASRETVPIYSDYKSFRHGFSSKQTQPFSDEGTSYQGCYRTTPPIVHGSVHRCALPLRCPIFRLGLLHPSPSRPSTTQTTASEVTIRLPTHNLTRTCHEPSPGTRSIPRLIPKPPKRECEHPASLFPFSIRSISRLLPEYLTCSGPCPKQASIPSRFRGVWHPQATVTMGASTYNRAARSLCSSR